MSAIKTQETSAVPAAHAAQAAPAALAAPAASYNPLLKSMCVPNWVLLYFKLQAKLPDSARQTLLKLTQLGRCGIKYLL